MALFDETLVQSVTALVRRRYAALGAALGQPAALERTEPVGEPTTLQHDLRLLMRIANGEVYRLHATPATVRQIEHALTRLLDVLLGNALEHAERSHPLIPEDFWRTELGILVSRVRWWLSADELITISNAAALAFGENTQANRMRIARAMENGQLEWVIDPSVANPQQNRRVLRPQVERLRDARRLPE